MALTTTTLSNAVAAGDKSIVIASASGLAARMYILIDQEMMQVTQDYVSGTTVNVLRGRGGALPAAHPASANVIFGVASDFAALAPQEPVNYPIAGRARQLVSYSAAGAITLPTAGNDMVAVINGTTSLAMTLADPGKDLDGSIIWIINGGKVGAGTATVTYSSGFGNAGGNYDVATFPAGGQTAICAMACNGYWLLLSPMTGTLTACVPALA